MMQKEERLSSESCSEFVGAGEKGGRELPLNATDHFYQKYMSHVLSFKVA